MVELSLITSDDREYEGEGREGVSSSLVPFQELNRQLQEEPTGFNIQTVARHQSQHLMKAANHAILSRRFGCRQYL
jgi:hypothetical protein